MKVLFLDVDGVLNNAETIERSWGFSGIDPRLASLVKRIRSNTGCKVVLSSSWTLVKSGQEQVEQHVGRCVDVTPMRLGSRGHEINAWLRAHPEVQRYAILDDDDDMLPEQLANLFQTSLKTGITEDIVFAIEQHLALT